MQFHGYEDLRSRLLSGELTCEQVISDYLQRIDSSRDDNIFTVVFHDEAMARARELDSKLQRGEAPGVLFGMPIAIKDNIAMKGAPLSCASKILAGYESVYDATVIKRMQAEDAIFVGRTNMDEFAMGSSNENSAIGPVPNPYDKTRVPGGSSGGSAAAVANDLAMVALGSDTGGSVRQPAGFCNIIGLKPTYGRISRYGLVAFASSFDQIGLLAANCDDAALVLGVIAGKDEHDATSSHHDVPEYDTAMDHVSVDGLRIGVPRAFFPESLNADVAGVVKAGLKKLEEAGAELVEIDLPESDYAIAAYYILVTAEASSNLARFDGARYGYRSPDSPDLSSMYVNSRTEGFGAEVKRRIMLGTYVLSAGYYDTYYKKAQQVRRVFQDKYREAFEKVDVIFGPTSPFPPFGIGDKMDNPLEMYLADVFTVPASIVGMPAISVPVGFDSLGLPVGAHLICNFFEEGKMLGIARHLQTLCQTAPSN
ncbi:MAG TPA: Asp-tRNA(Asn)/Glu-tRNA(Gln) amidotransferase GatCAB subunit A [Chlorobaculum sp.]|uniref:Glutamyl-tRNA(Gln) amidotransferase subunit A n=1 Tax=Chlorobaculum tepidum (strain ATCC 49652 / DSM 12025 / NBRC 103806 / TLS) TaxID=194439 RepID=GATA_CHLTE|nr:Asp-tRNA(Asn)/Glu-tRNA(Gln) amidotransferase subunit GatA [Chlorobaculum tepidum]Q8KFQ4.1 RecName: Full=Glutamyl-tRNA(Gln) amidotransferase subunit A; Short=Glu-ADT subunit A [Chlorobaculum tepidum TLS]AAM71514.1 glutamyl-tRNA(Gln) amidotransferase subunit A [Chlorobaculum tepidum TLS]HBU23742.1 Asp-tRNA(Asn)/Glu-tRNA(Gln) amidotransferase GatCAB subunit A [Chlorobaculum sp.]